MTTDTLVTERQLIRDMPDRSRVVAFLKIEQLAGNAWPHFSATADVYDAHGTHSGASRHRRGMEWDGGGMMHRAILDAFPGVAPFVAMHLADYPSGAPMHGPANAWYMLTPECAAYEARQPYGPAYYARMGSPLTRCANALRCDVDELPYGLVTAWADGAPLDDHREDFDAFVESIRPRWEREARASRALLESLPGFYSLRGYDLHGEPVHRESLPEWITGETGGTFVDV